MKTEVVDDTGAVVVEGREAPMAGRARNEHCRLRRNPNPTAPKAERSPPVSWQRRCRVLCRQPESRPGHLTRRRRAAGGAGASWPKATKRCKIDCSCATVPAAPWLCCRWSSWKANCASCASASSSQFESRRPRPQQPLPNPRRLLFWVGRQSLRPFQRANWWSHLACQSRPCPPGSNSSDGGAVWTNSFWASLCQTSLSSTFHCVSVQSSCRPPFSRCSRKTRCTRAVHPRSENKNSGKVNITGRVVHRLTRFPTKPGISLAMKTFSSLFFFLFLLRGGTLDTEMPPLLVLMDVILVVALIPEGLVLWKDDMGAPLILPNGLPFSSILVSLTPRRKRPKCCNFWGYNFRERGRLCTSG